MSRLRKFAALLLLALWLPATVHCQLEGLGLDALFACADQAPEATHTDKGACADDGCQTIESGQIALAKSRVDLSLQAALVSVCTCCLLTATTPAPAPEIFAVHQEKTLPLQRTWQFARRAALPARAPDPLNV